MTTARADHRTDVSRSVIHLLIAGALSGSVRGAAPEDFGVAPVTQTFYVNPAGAGDPPLNHNNSEAAGIDIASNGNVIIGWEDDHPLDERPVHSFDAVWTLFDRDGRLLLPEIPLPSTGGTTAGQQVRTTARAFFREDSSPVPGHTAFAPKIKANRFGPGVGFGATAFRTGHEIPWLREINMENDGTPEERWGDFPIVQLLTEEGAPLRILSGVSAADADRPRGIWISDWDYLSNGNIVIAMESRQEADLSEIHGGESPGNHVLFRILNPQTGEEVKPLTLASSSTLKSSLWHGLAVTRQGFAIRLHQNMPETAARTQVRFFDNDGTPLGPNIDIGTLTGHPPTSRGARGEATGFHGNGRGTVVLANVDQNRTRAPWITVLREDGAVRWVGPVADDLPGVECQRVDAAADEEGRVCVVFDAKFGNGPFLIMARVFNAEGEPLTGSFYVSERETPEAELSPLTAEKPRVAWRGGRIAMVWESLNSPEGLRSVAARFFKGPEPFRILEAKAAEGGGRVSLTWTSAPGNRYAVDASTDFATWTELQSHLAGPGQTLSWQDNSLDSPPGQKRFYRVRLLPHPSPRVENGNGNLPPPPCPLKDDP